MKNAGSVERMTSQKKIVLEYLKSVKTHPTAEVIFKEVKKKLPAISHATVYRILNNLKKKSQLQTISARKTTFFDGDTSDHAHFICEECGKVFDIFDVCSHCDILKNKRTKVGKINHFKIKFYGICQKCKSKR